jgi:sec-independent protein translocase protein TatB
MEFLGVGPLEILFIAILALLIVGPERLPDLGRFLGRMVARFLAWQQQSTEYQAIQKVRQDMEHEIVNLRNEIVQAKRHLASSVQAVEHDARRVTQGVTGGMLLAKKGENNEQFLSRLLNEQLDTPLSAASSAALSAANTSPQGEQSKPHPSSSPTAPTPHHPPEEGQPAADRGGSPEGQSRNGRHDTSSTSIQSPHSADPAAGSHLFAPPPLDTDLLVQQIRLLRTEMYELQETFTMQVQALTTDVRHLERHLQGTGQLPQEWEPPSHAMQRDTMSS